MNTNEKPRLPVKDLAYAVVCNGKTCNKSIYLYAVLL